MKNTCYELHSFYFKLSVPASVSISAFSTYPQHPNTLITITVILLCFGLDLNAMLCFVVEVSANNNID